jgi:prevent-host-death family protein
VNTISASSFKARCLALLDDVAESGGELTVTKHGRPVARVVPVEQGSSLEGSVRFLVSDEELVSPLGVGWEAEAGSPGAAGGRAGGSGSADG